MGNQCCAASQVPPNLVPLPVVDQGYTYEQAQPAAQTAVHSAPKESHETKKPTETQEEPKQQAADIAEAIQEQKDEENENRTVIPVYQFKKQLESLQKAIKNVENLKSISGYGKQLSQAIGELEVVLQILSFSYSNPSYIREIKSDLIGLYGDLQNFRSFHLRYTLDPNYFKDLKSISELSQFIKQVYTTHTKQGKTNQETFLKDLQDGSSHDAFEAILQKISVVRDTYNQVAGQNFSTLPNYLYITFKNEPGFALWTQLFPQDFEISNQRFCEKYSSICGVDKEAILKIISLLDNANDQRVDIYQWIEFVKEYQSSLDKSGKINADHISSFQAEIESKTAAQNHPPVQQPDGSFYFQSGMIYTGSLDENKKRTGKGKLVDEEYVLEGNFLNDLPHGEGKENRKKVQYVGQFQNGLYHGQGTLSFPNGRSYKGNFSQHQFSGEGTLVNDDGIEYQGTWKNGQLDHGRVTYQDGSFYVGQINQTFFKHGKGSLNIVKPSFEGAPNPDKKTILYIDGTWDKDTPVACKVYNFLETIMYDGTLNNWSISGKGKRTYVDGSYEGELLRDKRNNNGTLTYLNGDKFTGTWQEDLQVKGKFTYGKEKDHAYEGDWKNGQMTGKGKFNYASGGTYEGDVVEGKRQGRGVYKYNNGNKFEGTWINNNQEGEGKFFYASVGDIYSGQFKNGKYSGFGHYLYRKSGKQYIGFWDNDIWNGDGKFLDGEGKIIKCGLWNHDKLEKPKQENELIFPSNVSHLQLKPQEISAALTAPLPGAQQ